TLIAWMITAVALTGAMHLPQVAHVVDPIHDRVVQTAAVLGDDLHDRVHPLTVIQHKSWTNTARASSIEKFVSFNCDMGDEFPNVDFVQEVRLMREVGGDPVAVQEIRPNEARQVADALHMNVVIGPYRKAIFTHRRILHVEQIPYRVSNKDRLGFTIN